jgi:hypothetical protein
LRRTEIGGAYFLETQCGLPIIEWEPEGENGTRGEYLVGSGGRPIFVEVVTGGWQKEIKDAEGSDSPRLKLPKYLNGEARSVSNWQVIRAAVANKHKKFCDSRPNLLIIRDDYRIPLEKLLGPDIALYRSDDGSFANRRYERLGALAIFRCDLSLEEGLRYHFSVYDNPNAINAAKLPEGVFRDYPRRDRACRWRERTNQKSRLSLTKNKPMGIGPITIFDKSALQMLTVDEACWLETHYLSNITPLFFVETLADLQKTAAKRRQTPEQVVRNLAEKTPPGASPNVHHTTLCRGELLGFSEVTMDRRILLAHRWGTSRFRRVSGRRL